MSSRKCHVTPWTLPKVTGLTTRKQKTPTTYISAVQIKVSIWASITIPPNDVGLATAVSCEAVTDGQERFVVQVRADRVTLARLTAWWISGFVKGQSVAEESRFTAFAMESILRKEQKLHKNTGNKKFPTIWKQIITKCKKKTLRCLCVNQSYFNIGSDGTLARAHL